MKFVATGDPAEVDAGKLTLEVVREELAAVVEQRSVDDPHLSYVNGLDPFGPADVGQFPYADNLHPGAQDHRRIGERFIPMPLQVRNAVRWRPHRVIRTPH
jgi:hypothetical protein